jgi:hypothetical protein
MVRGEYISFGALEVKRGSAGNSGSWIEEERATDHVKRQESEGMSKEGWSLPNFSMIIRLLCAWICVVKNEGTPTSVRSSSRTTRYGGEAMAGLAPPIEGFAPRWELESLLKLGNAITGVLWTTAWASAKKILIKLTVFGGTARGPVAAFSPEGGARLRQPAQCGQVARRHDASRRAGQQGAAWILAERAGDLQVPDKSGGVRADLSPLFLKSHLSFLSNHIRIGNHSEKIHKSCIGVFTKPRGMHKRRCASAGMTSCWLNEAASQIFNFG